LSKELPIEQGGVLPPIFKLEFLKQYNNMQYINNFTHVTVKAPWFQQDFNHPCILQTMTYHLSKV